jgi:hypothetical protein
MGLEEIYYACTVSGDDRIGWNMEILDLRCRFVSM